MTSPPEDGDGDKYRDLDGGEQMEDRASLPRCVREAIEMLVSENVGVIDFDDTLGTSAGSYRAESGAASRPTLRMNGRATLGHLWPSACAGPLAHCS